MTNLNLESIAPLYSQTSSADPLVMDYGFDYVTGEAWQEIEYLINSTTSWGSMVTQLEADIKSISRRAYLERIVVNSVFAGVTGVVDFGTALASGPAAIYTLPAVTGLFEIQRNIVLDVMEMNIQSDIQEITRSALRGIRDSSGIPLDSKYPSGNPNAALQSIADAKTYINEKLNNLDDGAKALIFEAMSDSLTKLHNLDMLDTEANKASDSSIQEHGSKLSQKTDFVKDLTSKQAQAAKKFTQKADAVKDLLQSSPPNSLDDISFESELNSTAKVATEAFQAFLNITPNQIEGAIYLGLSPSTGEKIIDASAKINTILSIAAATTPVGATMATLGVIGMFSGRKSALGQGNKQVASMLNKIAKQNVQILKNQAQILKGISRILKNLNYLNNKLTRIDNLISLNIAETLQNRRILIEIINGPIKHLEIFFESESLAHFGYINGRFPSFKHFNEHWLQFGGNYNLGFYALETALSTDNISPIMQLTTYTSQQGEFFINDIGSISTKINNYTDFQTITAINKHVDRYHKLIDYASRGHISPRLFTEFSTLELLTDYYYDWDSDEDGEEDFRMPKWAAWDGQWPAVPHCVESTVRLANLAIKTAQHFEFLEYRNGSLEPKTSESLLSSTRKSIKGEKLLKNALYHINSVIAQQILLSGIPLIKTIVKNSVSRIRGYDQFIRDEIKTNDIIDFEIITFLIVSKSFLRESIDEYNCLSIFSSNDFFSSTSIEELNMFIKTYRDKLESLAAIDSSEERSYEANKYFLRYGFESRNPKILTSDEKFYMRFDYDLKVELPSPEDLKQFLRKTFAQFEERVDTSDEEFLIKEQAFLYNNFSFTPTIKVLVDLKRSLLSEIATYNNKPMRPIESEERDRYLEEKHAQRRSLVTAVALSQHNINLF